MLLYEYTDIREEPERGGCEIGRVSVGLAAYMDVRLVYYSLHRSLTTLLAHSPSYGFLAHSLDLVCRLPLLAILLSPSLAHRLHTLV